MIGTSLTFLKKTVSGQDAMGNDTTTDSTIVVDDCLIAPITEPATAREQQAMERSRDQVRIHLPKTYEGDVSDSQVSWNGKIFKVDSDSVVFMPENTPTRWNRYLRAESLNG